MESRVKLAGHAIHPMLIVFPLGLLAMAVIFDIIYFITGNTGFSQAANLMIPAGIIMGLLAALFGFLDWMALPGATRAKGIGLRHGGGNVIVVLLFFFSWLVRDRGNPSGLSFIISLVALALALVTAWLGGELVERLGVGVDRGANLDAPSSLSGQPAGETTTGTPASGRRPGGS